MQRKGNTISEKIQTGNQETFGIDMGGTLWATAIRDWESGKNSYYGLKDKEQLSKEERLFNWWRIMFKTGKRLMCITKQVATDSGRHGKCWQSGRGFTFFRSTN